MPPDRMSRRVRGDAAIQRAVLSLVLEAAPDPLTIPDLAQQFHEGEAERAVRELVGAGLLECSGVTVSATDAALRHDRLELP
jgi:hypothetical protein